MPSSISGKARVILCDLPLGDNQYIETWWVQAGHLKGNSGITNGGLAVLTSPGSQSQNMKPRGDEKVRKGLSGFSGNFWNKWVGNSGLHLKNRLEL